MGNGFSQPTVHQADEGNHNGGQGAREDLEEPQNQELDIQAQSQNENPLGDDDTTTDQDSDGPFFGVMSYLNMYFGSGGSSTSANESFGFSGDVNTAAANLADFSTSTSNMKSPTMKAAVNVLKPSIQLIPGESDQFGVRFTFDAATPGIIKILETENGNVEHFFSFQEGSGQQFTSPLDVLNTSMFSSEPEADGGIYSIALLLEAAGIECESDIRTQTTYCSVIKLSDDTFELKATKQTVQYSDLVYVVYDIFGLETGSALNEDCVICLSETKDTVLIPCRHLCVCCQCAQVLKFQSNKCPICRASVRSMLTVNITSDHDDEKPVGLDVQIDSDTDHSASEPKLQGEGVAL